MKKLLLLSITIVIFGCNSSILDDPSTKIKYSIPEPSHVRLTVENSYDTVVAILVDQDLPSGVFEANFDASNLAEGIYFYTLDIRTQSGNHSEITKRMLLIK
jgi:hypothetical protein